MPTCQASRCFEEDNRARSSRIDLGPVHRDTVELEKRFQELSAVVQKARDSFSCRLEEEQVNPLKDLRTRLLKAKERFHSRLANSSRFPDPSGFYPVERENPFQELRSVLRSARLNFVPLLDQYILDNSGDAGTSNSHDRSLEQSGESTRSRPFGEDQVGDPEPPESFIENNTRSNFDEEESPSRLHWLLEEETRLRRRSKSSSASAAGPKYQTQQHQEEGMNNASPPAPPVRASSARRLDLLIAEELDRKRSSGKTFQLLPP